MAQEREHRVVILGGGTGGLCVAARLLRRAPGTDVALVEPSEHHYYQPLWTLVGGGLFPREASERPEASLVPRGVTWIRDAAVEVQPAESRVLTRGGRSLRYGFLVMAPGIQLDWGKVEGLADCVGRGPVCSNYAYETVESTWAAIQRFEGGTALFTQPSTPIKCGGAPQKIAYLAEHAFRRRGLRDRTTMIFATGGTSLLASPYYAEKLRAIAARKSIDVRFRLDLRAVRPEAREAVFRDLEHDKDVVIPYDLLHATPPMSAPDLVKQSPLADEGGWVELDRATLRHPRYPNVFGLGDASGLPTSKTGAAIRKQAPVLVENLLAAMRGAATEARYDGYTSCPVVTSYGRLVMAEFDYEGKPRETFPIDQSKERLSMYLVKKYLLPPLYWHGLLRGRF